MAVEASRSTASADSYIGSLISLISKSEIRYEGILFNLNPEESSIGLRNVRSFGTEGRRKDGTHVSPIDKVYEYVVFRGTDIKDLQVKSSQPVQFPPHVPNDPAIIQSQYLQVSATSTSSSSATYGPASDLSTQMAEPDLWRSPFQGSLPLYQPGGSLGSWGSSTQPPSNGSGLVMPMYCQGFHRPSSSLQTQEKTLLQPPHGLPMPPSLQQSISCPMNVALPAGASNSSATQSSEFSPLLLPPIGISSLNLQSTIPVQSSALALELPMNSISTRAPVQIPSTVSQSFSLSLISPVAATTDKIAISYSVPDQAKHASSPMMPYNGVREPLSAAVGTSTSPSLVTPGHFLQPGTTTLLSSQSSQMMQKDAEVVLASASVSVTSLPLSTESVIATASASAEVQAPLLPLPSPSNPELDGVPLHNRYINTGGREIRGNEISQSAINFTEDFDFEAMNEKFKKDEVWGHLGKSKAKYNDGKYFQDEDDIEFPEVKIKPVYKKDDFFDSLSCNFLGDGSRNGRSRFSEQMRIDTETFGDLSSHRGGRGGRGPGRGGRSRGGFYGRGYGYGYGYCYSYVGRGRGHTVYRAT